MPSLYDICYLEIRTIVLPYGRNLVCQTENVASSRKETI